MLHSRRIEQMLRNYNANKERGEIDIYLMAIALQISFTHKKFLKRIMYPKFV